MARILLLVLAAVGASRAPRLQVGRTTLIGKATRASTEFLGIPFATAERFGKPVDAALGAVHGTLDATAFGPCCPQVAAIYAPNQQEQCLNLNVFAPKAPPPPRGGAPVLLFIHGGGGTTGCSAQSNPPLYNGTNMLRRLAARGNSTAVIVTVNYRLSVLANLYLADGSGGDAAGDPAGAPALPDNLQVRDWTSALRWVRRHISAFGGDPSRVLIFGESAGGNAVQLLALAPGAAGLFQHVLSESGTFALATGFDNATTANAKSRAVAAHANCTQPVAADVLACLRARTAEEVQASAAMAQLAVVVGTEQVPRYPARSLAAGTGVSAALQTVTAGWNTPDNFNLCASAAGRAAGPAQAAAYLAQNIPLWTGAGPADVAAVLAAYNASGCAPEADGMGGRHGGDSSGSAPPACCALADTILLDATMRCPVDRSLGAYAKHRPDTAQFMYTLGCCPTCPAPGRGEECVCQHTSELAYVFGTVSDYESGASPAPALNCTPEATFTPFSDALIDTWVGIAANGSHGPSWPEFGGGAMVFLDEQAQGGPSFTPQAWDAAAHHCELWQSIDDAAATAKFGTFETESESV